MRITDNPALTSSTLSGTDVMLLTDVDDLTNGKPKDKKLSFNSLAAWIANKASVAFNSATGGNRTIQDLVETKIISQDTINLNDYTTPGHYVMGNVEGRTYTNYPPDGSVNGWLDVYKYTNNIVKQYWHRLGSIGGNTYKYEWLRMYGPVTSGGATVYQWSDWERIVNKTLLDDTISGLGVTNAVVDCSTSTKSPESGGANNAVVGDTGTLSPGTYLLIGGGCWASNNTGSRSLHFTTSSYGSGGIAAAHITSAPANGQLWMQVFHLVTINANTTFYLACWQNSGAALTFNNTYLKYIKLHN